MENDDFRTEEPTQPIPHLTLDEISKQWRQELSMSERPTRDLRMPHSSRSRAVTEVMEVE